MTLGRQLKRSILAFAPFSVWWTTWAALALAAATRRPSTRVAQPPNPSAERRLDVLIPAYNEADVLPALFNSLKMQTEPRLLNRVLVVADHCEDNTAEVAIAAGFEALERNSGDNGKPLALKDGLALLAAAPDRGDAVIIVDADCVCEPSYLEKVAARLEPGLEVLQTSYLIQDPAGKPVREALRLSFALRNVVRPAGAERLALPVGLFGSGMVLRWEVTGLLSFTDQRPVRGVARSPSGTDLSMWLDVLSHGVKPAFVEDARLFAPPPKDDQDLARQRLRWERGQVRSWRRSATVGFKAARRKDWKTLVALIDWSAPPLVPTALSYVALAVRATANVVMRRRHWANLVPPGVAGGALVTYLLVGTAYLEGWRGIPALLSSVPRYVVWKARAYRSLSRAHEPGTTLGA